MKTVLLRGPLLSASGYGVHARQLARWLFREAAQKYSLDISTEVLGWGQTHWLVDSQAEDGLVGEILQATSKAKPFYDVTIQLQLPNEWNPMLGAFNVGVTAAVETDRCNPQWVDAVNSMSLVIVPSEFTKQCLTNTGVCTTPIVVVPEAFPDGLLKDVPPLDLELSTPFNFLVFGQLTGTNIENDRKNLPYTVKWFADAFAGNDQVGVVLKINMGCQTKLDRANVYNLFNRLLTELKVNPVGPKFYLLHGDMTTEELKGLFTHPKIKAMASFTHGEGFGLPLLEAAACDLPIIASAWSAHTEFLSLGKYIPIACSINQIPPSRVDNQIFMADAKWAMPFDVDVHRQLKKFASASTLPKKWATDMGIKIREKYCFSAIATQLDAALKECL